MDKQNRKIILAGVDNYTSTNSLGIQAMSDGMLHKLETIFPNDDIALHYKTLTISKNDWRLLRMANKHSLLQWATVRYLFWKFRKKELPRIERIKESKLLIISGDGIMSDIFCGWGLCLCFEMMVALKYNIPVCFVNQSINVAPRGVLGNIIKNYFHRCHIAVRENISATLLDKSFHLKNIPVSIDSAFYVPPLTETENQQFSKWLQQLKAKYLFDDYIVVGIRGKRPAGQIVSVKSWVDVIQFMVSEFPLHKIVFASSCPREDLPLAKSIQKEVNDLVVVEELFDSEKYHYRFLMHFQAKAKFVLSDRYHQLILSLLVGTPVVPLEGNTSKTEGLFEMLDYPLELLPVLQAGNLGKCKDVISQLSENYEKIRDGLPTEIQLSLLDKSEVIFKPFTA